MEMWGITYMGTKRKLVSNQGMNNELFTLAN